MPLVASAHGLCPYCGASYPVPETYRTLHAESLAIEQRQRARALLEEIARPPPRLVRVLAVLGSPWFAILGAGLWLPLGIVLGLYLVRITGRHVFHVNTYDVLSDQRQQQLALLVPLLLIAIGVTSSVWARRRGILRGGLQAALAASPPTKPGGPTLCRQCSAPLSPTPNTLYARCAYCGVDNLTEAPPAWIAQMRAHARTMVRETAAAARMWKQDQAALRWRMLRNFGLFILLCVLPLHLIIGASAGREHRDESMLQIQAAGVPSQLPDWHESLAHRSVDGSCTPPPSYRSVVLRCHTDGCDAYEVVPLRRDEVLTHVTTDLSDGSKLVLETHEESFLSDEWAPVAEVPLIAGKPVATRVPYSGWYRLHIETPRGDDRLHIYCASIH